MHIEVSYVLNAIGEVVMPVFTVLRRVDAFIDYTTQIDAANAKDAAEFARRNADRLSWKADGEHEFDAQTFITRDSTGNEIADSECGDFC